MRKLLIVTETGVMLVPEKHGENHNRLNAIIDTWSNWIISQSHDTLEFFPEEPTPTIPGLLSHMVIYPVSKVIYIVDMQVSMLDVKKPELTIIGSMSDIKS